MQGLEREQQRALWTARQCLGHALRLVFDRLNVFVHMQACVLDVMAYTRASCIPAGTVRAQHSPSFSRRHVLLCRSALTAEAPAASSSSSSNGTKQGPIIMNGQVLHSCSHERLEIVKGLEQHIEQQVLPVLKPVSKCWQPADLLPRAEDPDFLDQV